MSEKLATCIKMLDYLKKDSIKFLYNAGNQGPLPIKPEEQRHYMNFVLYKDGLMEYRGADNTEGGYYSKRRQDVKISGIIPTETLIDFAYSKLKNICLETAREHVMQRLIEHELKYNALEFLLDNNEKTVH